MSRSSYWLLTGPVLVTLFGACSAADPGAEAQAVGSTAGLSHEVRARHERVRAFFRDRAQSESVAQTRTESGTVVDWLPKPGNLPALPPTPAAFKDGLTPAARTELQAQPEARGPAGTVPRVRFDVEAYLRAVGEQVPEDPSQVLNEGPDRELKLDELLKFPRARLPSAVRSVAGLLDVSPAGAEAGVTRLALGRGVRSQRESIVVGASLDDQPTLFTYYTTNGSRSAGDWLGGFDQRQAGFCQVSQTVVAGERLALPSKTARVPMAIELHDGRWWVFAAGEWVGFYPRCRNVACGEDTVTCNSERPFLFSRNGLRHRADYATALP